jgi:hypothetical protein
MNIQSVPCLAILISSSIPDNIGMVVEVLQPDPWQTEVYGEFCWEVRAQRPAMREDGVVTSTGSAKDNSLRPITGLPLTEDTPEGVKEPA